MESTEQRTDLKLSAGHGADWWAKEVERCYKHWKTYRDRAEKVVKRYRDEREKTETEKRFNILFSNTETLGPAIYSQVPVPDIRRRWQDKDVVGRVAATVLQRATSYCMESYDFDSVLDRCKLDYLLPGFAIAQVVYKPLIKGTPKKGENGKPVVGEDKQPVMDEELLYEEAETEYISWDRFAMSRSKTYDRVWWGAVAEDMTKDEVVDKFGQEVADKLTYGRMDEGDGDKEGDGEGKCRVWAVWCKRSRSRFYLAEGHTDWLRKPEVDPLKLERFFPWPKPIWSITTNETLIPIPEYTEYQDQARELDDLTHRIDVLTSSLRRRGVYASGGKDELQRLANAPDNTFLPVTDWAALMEKGGLKNLIEELSNKETAEIIIQLEERREKVKQTIYEVTGIADIVRGSSNPNETLGAQELKGKWAGLRISSRQKKFAAFARDLVRLKAEIIAERFKPETLALMSGMKLPYQEQKASWMAVQQQQAQQAQAMAAQAQAAQQQPPPPPQPNPEEAKFFAQPTWEEVLKVLRTDKLRGFKIDIETDSTVQPDADAEKAARNELLTAVGGASQQLGAAVQMGIVPPKLATLLIQFVLRAYKAGSSVEEELEQMGEDPVSPQMKQAQQAIQQKEAELAEREKKVTEAEHGAAIQQKDVDLATEKSASAAKDVAAKQAALDVSVQHEAEIRALREQYENEMKALVQTAEATVKEIMKKMRGETTPEGA